MDRQALGETAAHNDILLQAHVTIGGHMLAFPDLYNDEHTINILTCGKKKRTNQIAVAFISDQHSIVALSILDQLIDLFLLHHMARRITRVAVDLYRGI